MSCEVTGIPAPDVTWTTHGDDVTDVKDPTTFHVLANGALRIDHVTVEDGGMYECVATNIAGNATKAVTLNVQGTSFCRLSLYSMSVLVLFNNKAIVIDLVKLMLSTNGPQNKPFPQ